MAFVRSLGGGLWRSTSRQCRWRRQRLAPLSRPPGAGVCSVRLLETASASDVATRVRELQRTGAVRKLAQLCLPPEVAEGEAVSSAVAATAEDAGTFAQVLRALIRLNSARWARAVMEHRFRLGTEMPRADTDPAAAALVSSYVALLARAGDVEALRASRAAFEAGLYGEPTRTLLVGERVYHRCAQAELVKENAAAAVDCIRALGRLAQRVSDATEGEAEAESPPRTDTDEGDQAAQLAASRLDLYEATLRAFGKKRYLRGVFTTIETMHAAGLEPNAAIFEALATSAVREVDFVKGAVSMATLPPPQHPEVAFAGRSNVGKSSLVNMLVGRRALAKISKTPGKTQQFNYFVANARDRHNAFYLVDLPGVGYARVSKQQRGEWERFFVDYVAQRQTLRLLFHLIDSRVGVLDEDRRLMHILAELFLSTNGRWNIAADADAASGPELQYVVVLTKADKTSGISPRVQESLEAALEESRLLQWRDVPIAITSATTKRGRDAMWRFMRRVNPHWR
ncbi:hypothetical protein CDCA_CDCA10G2958 [Cyanidium caldarium]|uniref:EngB-type G domain-containing protein n=1 Tax=Cyanidium caldarium TaxID=2771 RepID=A0AAV9IXV7_CYACA|nr:hypothetical protein CDCA_CDCA10G2958 [Cyanidium caldarium]